MNQDTKHVLLVLDDDFAVRESLKFLLEIEGFDVRTFASPDELLNENSLPDCGCLIVDYHMPAMNGLDVVAKLRKGQNSLPAILITAHPDVKIRERASAAGVSLIDKPFQQTALLECIRRLLDGQSPTRSQW